MKLMAPNRSQPQFNPFGKCRLITRHAVCAMVAVILFVPAAVLAGSLTGGSQMDSIDVSDIDKSNAFNILDSTSLLVVPVPVSNPTTGSGAALVGAVFFKMDEDSKPSIFGVGGAYTSNGTWGGGAATEIAFDRDRYLAEGLVGYADVNYDFYGIGAAADERFVHLDEHGGTIKGEFLARIAPKFYIGGGLRYLDLITTFGDPGVAGSLLGDNIPVPKLENKVYSLSLNFTYDSRDKSFSPSSGQLIAGEFAASGRNFLTNSGYFKSTVDYNRYDLIADDLVLASRVSLCDAGGNVPLFDLCAFGANNDLRGYAVGKIQDRAMIAGQFELRWHDFWRIGFVAFAGAGAVAHSIDDFETPLASAGVGIRFLASKDYDVNIGIDGAITREGDTAWYIQVGEAF
jgi:Omp85 superfamily domain